MLRALHDELHKEGDFAHCVGIYGIPGVGKTRLALEFAARHKSEYNDFVLWIGASNQLSIIDALVKIARATKCIPEGVDPEDKRTHRDIAIFAKQWLEGPKVDKWLVIFDNIDDVSDVTSFVPVPAPSKHILLTTRFAVHLKKNDFTARAFQLSVMDIEDAVTLLLRRALPIDAEATADEETCAREIVAELGCLPLAINQAGSYLLQSREGGMKLSDFLPEYRAEAATYLGSRLEGDEEYPISVRTTFLLSYNLLLAKKKRGLQATRLLKLLAFFHPDTTHESFLVAGLGRLVPELQTVLSNRGLS